MADGISYTVVTKPFTDFVDGRQLRMRRAAMYTVRQAGRVCKVAAKVKAPVLQDKTAESRLHYNRAKQWRSGGAPVRGLLRSSIASSRRLKQTGDTWSLKVGPRGPRVHLYAEKIEIQAAYMKAGYEAAVVEMPAIAEKVYQKVWVE